MLSLPFSTDTIKKMETQAAALEDNLATVKREMAQMPVDTGLTAKLQRDNEGLREELEQLRTVRTFSAGSDLPISNSTVLLLPCSGPEGCEHQQGGSRTRPPSSS